MSSATRFEPGAGGAIIGGVANRIGKFDEGDGTDQAARVGLSPRQQELNRLWSYYKCRSYDARQWEFDGSKHVEHLEHESIASAGFIPPGFIDVGGSMLPLRFRRPSSPYALIRVIVNRFTGLLFSEKRHPKISIPGDTDSEEYVAQLAEVGRLWPTMMQARAHGGATGTVPVGFSFVEGRLRFEVHDPIWTTPIFLDRASLLLKAIDKRYIFPSEVRNPETGKWEIVPMWYRRVIDQRTDTVYVTVPVEEGEEPEWQPNPDLTVEHNFGFCPVVWIQNLPVSGEIDGEPDCEGIFELNSQIDILNSSADRAVTANMDPTLVIATDAEMGGIRKGGDNAIKLPSGGSANYLEIAGGGIKSAQELAKERREQALEVAQCVLEGGDGPVAQTATEIERRYSSMLSKADMLREQYGERGVKPLMDMVIRAIGTLSKPKPGVDPVTKMPFLMRQTVYVPPKIEPATLPGQPPTRVERKLGPGPHIIELKWPGYFEPTLQDTNTAVQAAGGAKTAGLIDDETATKFVAPYLGIEDVAATVAKMQNAALSQQNQLEQMALAGGGVPPGAEPATPLDEEGPDDGGGFPL